MPVNSLLFQVQLKILKSNLSVLRYCVGNGVNGIVNALIHTFNTVLDINLALKKLTVIYACKTFDFSYEIVGFVLGYEF